MKLTAILLTVFFLQVQANGISQTVTFSGKEVPLKKVLTAIEKQTGYIFFYTMDIWKEARPVTIKVKNAAIDAVLKLVMKEQPFSYIIENKTIIISRKKETVEEKANGDKVSAFPDPIEVRGVVTDENGAPAQGVNVMVKGTSKGTTTNLKGEFVLRDVPENAVLIITSVGYDRQEIAVKEKTLINTQLKVAVGNLDEMQVIAYGTTSKRFQTGNVSTVKAKDIEKQPVQNPLLALQGRVPGIEITQLSGMPGGGVTVRVQGRNSIQSGLDPLIVIDGVLYPSQLSNTGFESIVQGGSPLNYINPADIESIDILKDADATAIYGSRAANGAILISTKKGKAGRTRLNVNLQQGWGKVTRKVDLMNTRQYLDMRYEALKNDGIELNTLSNTDRGYSDLIVWDTTRYTNWQKTLIGGTAQYTDIRAGISGGTATLQYLLSGTINRQTTVFPSDFDDRRGGLHFNFNGGSLNQKFHFGLSGNYLYDRNHLPNVDLTSLIYLAPNAPAIYNDNGTLNWAPNAAGRSTWSNPLASLSSEFNSITKNLISNANFSYSLLPGLEIRSNFGYTSLQSDLYAPTKLEFYRPEIRPFSQRNSNFANRSMSSWIIEPQIHYTGRLSKGKLEGLLAATISQNTTNVLAFDATGFSSDLLMKSPSAATSITMYSSSASSMSKYNALFGRINYNFEDKYLINLSARRDGSSKFGDESKFHNFYSVGAGWIFSQEKFIKDNLAFVSFGKLRASFGTTGNDQIPDYSYLSLYYNSYTTIPYQNATGLEISNLPNPHLQWEKTRKWQGGIDLGFINDRVLLNITYAQNRSSNQLVSSSLPTVTGFSNIIENLPATIQNVNWEFMLNTINVKGRHFNWTTSANLTIPKNKLLSFPNIESTSYASGDIGVIVGEPLGVVKVFRYVEVDPATGNDLVLDKNGMPTSSPNYSEDRTSLVAPITKFYGGFQNSISYKGLQLDFLFQFVRQIARKDLYYFNGNDNPGFFQFFGGNQPVTALNRWQKPGDNALVGRYTVMNFGVPIWAPYSDAGYSDEASFIRLKNVSLSWQLPSAWLKKAHLQSARFYFNGQNLASITNYTGLDPETRSSSSLPPLQLWTLGVQIEL